MRRLIVGLVISAVASSAALRPASRLSAGVSRRVAISAAISPLLLPLTARAETGALGATCLGFSCNPYGNTDFNGLSAEDAPAGAMPYADFLSNVKEGKVQRVLLMPPSGDEAYAFIGGKKVRMGAGWPIEDANGWSSPSWVVRILENERIPYEYAYDLNLKPTVRTGKPERYIPGAKVNQLERFNKMQKFERVEEQGVVAYRPVSAD